MLALGVWSVMFDVGYWSWGVLFSHGCLDYLSKWAGGKGVFLPSTGWFKL